MCSDRAWILDSVGEGGRGKGKEERAYFHTYIHTYIQKHIAFNYHRVRQVTCHLLLGEFRRCVRVVLRGGHAWVAPASPRGPGSATGWREDRCLACPECGGVAPPPDFKSETGPQQRSKHVTLSWAWLRTGCTALGHGKGLGS